MLLLLLLVLHQKKKKLEIFKYLCYTCMYICMYTVYIIFLRSCYPYVVCGLANEISFYTRFYKDCIENQRILSVLRINLFEENENEKKSFSI